MKTSILLIDNYDSFTYNLYHMIKHAASDICVIKNDNIDIEKVKKYDKIMISPGPGIPDDAGKIKAVIHHYKDNKDILGVCLGLQAIAEVFGGKLENLETVYHGVATLVEIVQHDKLFKDIPKKFKAGRYHSWVMSKQAIPNHIEVIAKDDQDEIMAIRIKNHAIRGVQFHPESVLTDCGEKIIHNWLRA